MLAGKALAGQPGGGGGGSASGAAAAAAWPLGWACQLAARRLGGFGGSLRAPSGDPRARRNKTRSRSESKVEAEASNQGIIMNLKKKQ